MDFKDTGPDYLNQIISNLKKIDGKKIEVGIIGNGQGEIATYASVNEFGTNKAGKNRNITIPERAFLRSTFDDPEAVGKATKNLDEIFKKDFSPNVFLNRAGVILVAEVQKKIASNIPPANAPSTKARKKSGKTLIDNGTLRKAIGYNII